MLSFFQFVQSSSAQVSCGGQQLGEECIKYPGQTYQCIDGDFFSGALYGAQLLPPAQAQNTAQFIIIKGKVTFNDDYTFAAGSDIVFLDNSSGLKVTTNKKLTLTSSWLHGCTKLWAGIELSNSAKIVAQNCTFEDAKAAIILRSQTVAEITGNTFKKNVCGILGLSTNPNAPPISILLGSRKGISGNIFWGNHQLLEPIVPKTIDPAISTGDPTAVTNFPYVGIWIERVNSLSIGIVSNQAGVPFNSFLNFGKNKEQNIRTRGILSIQSNVSIQNSTFSNFGTFDPVNSNNNISAEAVYAANEGVVITQTTFTGTNQTASIFPSNTFANCWLDIHTSGTNLTVTNMTSFKAYKSIRAYPANGWQGAQTYRIKNNKIDYFRDYGIDVAFTKPFTIDIQNNQLFDNNEPFDPAVRYGIYLFNTTDTEINLNGSLIKNNEIRSRSILQGGVFWGIALRKAAYLTIEQNQVFDNLAQSSLAAFYGIRTQQSPCTGLRLFSNTINGAKIDYSDPILGPTPSSGIHVNESVNCVLNCNETDKTNMGVLFSGMCDNANVSKNRLNYHGIGLGLGAFSNSTTEIGLQSKKENRWFGTNSPIEAYSANLATALASKFEINSSDLNSDYWPLPRKIGANDDNLVWFTQLMGQEPSNDFTCLTGKIFGEGALAGSDIRLLNGTYSPPLNYPALTWEAKWQFAARLNRNPSLQTIDGATTQYFQNTYNDSYSHLNRAYQSYLNRWLPSTAIANQMGVLETAVEQRFALDATLFEILEDNGTMHAQMLAADTDIADKTASLKTAMETWIATVNQNVNALLTEVNSVTTTQEHETDMKSVLSVMFQSHLAAGELNAQQTALIAQIAGKCRYSGGYAVLLARGFFEPQDSYSQDAACQSEERNSPVTSDISDLVALYPNPATESFVLSAGIPFEQGQVQVFNSQGVLVRSVNLTGIARSVSVADLPDGVYYLHVRFDSGVAARKAFVKIK
ncbi:MAG: NosD domain-containing protein [Saprospiraceae bacterium]